MNEPFEESLEKRVRKARRWARVGGARAYSAQDEVTTERKGKNEGLVTELDRSIETYLRQKIHDCFPEDRIIGEEFSPEGDTSASLTWFLDPIDGTAGYSMSLPIWTVCLGLAYEQRPVAGVMWAPGVEDEYYGWKNGPSRINSMTLSNRVSSVDSWDDETLLCVRSDTHRRWDVEFVGKCRSLGSSAYHMGLVLDGRAVGALLGHLNIWDVAAACGVASNTGFRLSTVSDKPPDWPHFTAGNPSRKPLVFAHESVLDEVQSRVTLRSE